MNDGITMYAAIGAAVGVAVVMLMNKSKQDKDK